MKKIICAALVLACLSGMAFAQVVPQDAMELQLWGYVDFQGPAGKSVYNVEAAFGYFIMDDIEVGPVAAIASDGEDNGLGLGMFGEYNIDIDSSLVPYLGLSMVYLNGDIFNKNALQIEGSIGLKFFLAENVAVSGAFAYDYATADCYYNDNKWQDTDYGLKFAVRAFF